jgi:hypothetical protein
MDVANDVVWLSVVLYTIVISLPFHVFQGFGLHSAGKVQDYSKVRCRPRYPWV